jgi:hypothetical protein
MAQDFCFWQHHLKRRIVGLSTQLRWFYQEQKDQPECSSYFVHVPKSLCVGWISDSVIQQTPLLILAPLSGYDAHIVCCKFKLVSFCASNPTYMEQYRNFSLITGTFIFNRLQARKSIKKLFDYSSTNDLDVNFLDKLIIFIFYTL